MIAWLASLFRREPDEPDSDYPGDIDCPTTQPTSPGALDSDMGDAMKTAILAIVILTLAGCATIPGLEISDEERAACERDGCSVWTVRELEDLVILAMRKGYENGRKSI